jgi:hypothetical protein
MIASWAECLGTDKGICSADPVVIAAMLESVIRMYFADALGLPMTNDHRICPVAEDARRDQQEGA